MSILYYIGSMATRARGSGTAKRVVAAVLVAMTALAGCQNGARARWSAGGPAPSATATPATPAPSVPTTAGGGTPASVPSWQCARSTAPCPVPGKVIVGAYLDLSGMNLGQSLALRHQQFGRYPRIVHLFYNWTDGLPDQLPHLPSGSVAMLSWRGTAYASITNGSQDGLIVQAARAMVRYRMPVFLRWGWEMNGDWYPWGGARNDSRTAGYIAAWRHIHDIFTAQHVVNVAWVWAPNYDSQPTEPWNDLRNYYPGDGYVDWVGVSGYSFGRQTPDELFDGLYGVYATRKPIMLAETGVVDVGGQVKPDWIRALTGWLVAHPAVASLVWFDTDDPNLPNWRIDTSAAAVAAYKQLLDNPYFAG